MTVTAAESKTYGLKERLVHAMVGIVDPLLRAAAWAASKVSRVSDAGAFYYPERTSFYDAWREGGETGRGSLTLRLGHVELVVDYRADKAGLTSIL